MRLLLRGGSPARSTRGPGASRRPSPRAGTAPTSGGGGRCRKNRRRQSRTPPARKPRRKAPAVRRQRPQPRRDPGHLCAAGTPPRKGTGPRSRRRRGRSSRGLCPDGLALAPADQRISVGVQSRRWFSRALMRLRRLCRAIRPSMLHLAELLGILRRGCRLPGGTTTVASVLVRRTREPPRRSQIAVRWTKLCHTANLRRRTLVSRDTTKRKSTPTGRSLVTRNRNRAMSTSTRTPPRSKPWRRSLNLRNWPVQMPP